MDGFDRSNAPVEYQRVEWISDIFVFGMGVCWLINYAGMIYTSLQEQTYSMAPLALCCNFAWEMVYGLIYPSKSRIEQGVFLAGLVVNLGVMYTAIRFAPNEWAHAPLVMNNITLIFALGVLGSLTGHLALAAEIGPALGYSWGAVACQLLLSVGGFCQLLGRSSSRGASYTLWLSRFIGSGCVVGFAILRYMYWSEAFNWLNSPLVLWSLGVFIAVDSLYGICLWNVKKYEHGQERSNARKAQ
uniref:Terpene cyclase nodB n=1 Tax=Hypoxylon pulicicidum TaxID=1243767 RepID=NODB_HYPPI|nr:RecName: Full=Terpene cyclase nodB; AltName: Full=Nodulisporic acid biosynthesis cluster protein B [Hypoxylon pulicicidum]AUM60064.1 indole diterpene cyclase [Hypoxylon pulicicidum]